MLRVLLIAVSFLAALPGQLYADNDVVWQDSASQLENEELKTFEGKLIRVMAFGGETTGAALELDNGNWVELDFKRHAIPFSFERRMKVTGYFVTVRGVEVPHRRVLIVTAAMVLGN